MNANRPPPPPYGSIYNNTYEGSPLVDRALESSKSFRAARSYGRLAFIRDAMFVIFAIFFVLQNLGTVATLADDVPPAQKREMRRLWKHEQRAHDSEVALWDRERADHDVELARWVQEREAFEQEQAEWARLRLEEEHRRKEVEKRRLGVHWSDSWRSGRYTCTAYGTRAYTAILLDIPSGLDWFEVCSDMPITINGKRFDRPDWCERGYRGEVYASWFVDDHPECRFVWAPYRDGGCGDGKRRYVASLMGLHHGDDWDRMCQTTPANINGVHFTQPHTCFDDKPGRTGMWEIDDPRCR